MHQNRRLLLEKKVTGPARLAINVEVTQSLNLSQSMGRPFDESISQSLNLVQTLKRIQEENVSQSLVFVQSITEQVLRLVSQSLNLQQTVSSAGSEYIRSISQSLFLSQSATAYIVDSNNQVKVLPVCDETGGGSPDEDFVLEEVP